MCLDIANRVDLNKSCRRFPHWSTFWIPVFLKKTLHVMILQHMKQKLLPSKITRSLQNLKENPKKTTFLRKSGIEKRARVKIYKFKFVKMA